MIKEDIMILKLLLTSVCMIGGVFLLEYNQFEYARVVGLVAIILGSWWNGYLTLLKKVEEVVL